MRPNEFITYILNGFTYILVLMQTNQTFQMIEMILAILTSIVLLAYRIWRWWKEAKKDGKITKEEINDGLDIIINGAEDIKDKIKKGDKDNGKDARHD